MTAAPPAAQASATPAAAGETLVDVRNLSKLFSVHGGILQRKTGEVRAVDDVSFTVRRGETLGLVGESGCGKTTVGRLLLRLITPTSGQIVFDGRDIAGESGARLKAYRRRMQIIFQDPYSSLDPRTPIGDSIGEGLRIHRMGTGRERRAMVERIMQLVGLEPYHARRYPHEFSGGQRQRIGIARALVLEPDLVVCDEPVSALDVSIQAQVLNLLARLQRELGLTYVFIAHNLAVVEHISDRVAVMYLGTLAEVADSADLYRQPLHPYTLALLSAVPIANPVVERRRKRIILSGDVPSPINPPSGCVFHTRCWLRRQLGNPDRCVTERPELRQVVPNHRAACHFSEELVAGDARARRVDEAAASSSAIETDEEEAAAPQVPATQEKPSIFEPPSDARPQG